MSTDAFMSACPVVDHEYGIFARVIDVSKDRGILKIVPFESDVQWLREGQYSLALYNPMGKILKNECTTGDYHEFLTAYRDPINDAQQLADEFGVTSQSVQTVEVRMSVIERPVYAVEDPIVYRNSTRYRPIPSGWFRYHPAMVAEWEETRARGDLYEGFDSIEKRTLFEATIWNSRLGSSRQAQYPALRAAIERALRGVENDIAAEARFRLETFVSAAIAT